jgi:hypothetical protein
MSLGEIRKSARGKGGTGKCVGKRKKEENKLVTCW